MPMSDEDHEPDSAAPSDARMQERNPDGTLAFRVLSSEVVEKAAPLAGVAAAMAAVQKAAPLAGVAAAMARMQATNPLRVLGQTQQRKAAKWVAAIADRAVAVAAGLRGFIERLGKWADRVMPAWSRPFVRGLLRRAELVLQGAESGARALGQWARLGLSAPLRVSKSGVASRARALASRRLKPIVRPMAASITSNAPPRPA
jgi:hypothetical protein